MIDDDGEPVPAGSTEGWDRGDPPSALATSPVPSNWHRKWLYDRSPLGVAWLSPAGEIVTCNDAFGRHFGARPMSLRGRAIADVLVRSDRERIAEQLSKLVMRTARSARIDHVRAAGGAPEHPLLTLFASAVGGGQDAVAIVLQVIESHARHSDAGELLQQQKMQAVGQLAGGIAHDFNNLLTGMLGFCDLLLSRHGPGEPSHDDIAQVRANAQRACDLVRQLLAFSRKQSLQPVLVDVERALDNMVAMLRRLLGPAIDLQIRRCGPLPRIKADPGQFDQVIINLAVNARDAMPGGGALTIQIAPVTIGETVAHEGEMMERGVYVRIDVSDTGVGIPGEIIDKIFEPFFTTKDNLAGTGLGLATVHGIVRQTGGFIFVDSALGEGTTFTLYLPRAVEDEATDDSSAAAFVESAVAVPTVDALSAPSRRRGGLTVLLVDDEDSVRVFAARGLRSGGLDVLEADSAERALDVLAAHDGRIDLLLTDVVMPGMDGYALAQLVRRDIPNLRVIAMSGYQEDVVSTGEVENDAIQFLQKPFTLGELAVKVRAVLDSRD